MRAGNLEKPAIEEPEGGETSEEIRKVTTNGQISIGKEFAGKMFRVEVLAEGKFLLTWVLTIPASEAWTMEEPHASRIAAGMERASRTEPRRTDLKALRARLTAERAAEKSKKGQK